MKKKICICLLIMIFIFNLNISISYGHKSTGIAKQLGDSIKREEWGSGNGNTEEEAKMLEQLKVFGYDGLIQDEIRWETTIKICIDKTAYNDMSSSYNSDPTLEHNRRVTGKYWQVIFDNGVVEKDVKFDDLRVTYACEHHKPSDKEIEDMVKKAKGNEVEVYKYKAVVIAKKDLSNLPNEFTESGEPIPGLRYFLVAVYTGRDMEEGNKVKISSENTAIQAISGKAEAKLPNPFDFLKELWGWFMLKLHDSFRAIPDALQMGINTIGRIDTIEAKTVNAEPDPLTVPVGTIELDSKKNERAQLTTGDINKGDPNKQEIYDVDAKDANFTEDIEIPTIPLDMYNIIYGKIDFLDVNFFNVDTSKHQEGTYWMFLRKVFSGALHIMIYLSIAFLIATLIIHGIMMVKNTMIPEKKKEQIDGLRHFVVALIMLVGSVLIMNLCIYGVNFFTSYFGNEEVGDAFIRVNVSGGDKDFSFNANLTEFTRFMTQINTVEKLNDKIMYIAMYSFLVFANLVTLLIMLIRSFMIIILSVQGPIVATAYAIDKKVFNMSYSDWVKKYLKWTSVQLVLMLGYRLIVTLGRL